MSDYTVWLDGLRAYLKTRPPKPSGAAKAPPKAAPGFGPAKSVGPIAPILKQAEGAAKGKPPASKADWYKRR